MVDELTPLQTFTRAFSTGDLKSAQNVVTRHPEVITQPVLDYNFTKAASNDDVAAMEYLLKLGANFNARIAGDEPEGSILGAAGNGAVNAVKWLIDRGAPVSLVVDGETRCLPLVSAAWNGHLEVVKLLVERGVDVNTTWNGTNALFMAEMYNQDAVVEYLRSVGAKTPEELGYVDDADEDETDKRSLEEQVLDHIHAHIGESRPLKLTTVVPTEPDVSIHLVDMDGGILAVTVGMSSQPMHVPKRKRGRVFAEVMMFLPEDWPHNQKSLRKQEFAWPFEWLRRIALYPHSNKSCLPEGSVVFANGEPPKPFADNTQLSCLLAVSSPPELPNFFRDDDQEVAFYLLFPLYAEEREYERTHGTRHLLELFEEREVSRVLDVDRPSVCSNS